MKVFASLAMLYVRSFYHLPGKRTPGRRATLAERLKPLGVVALILLLVGNFGYLFVTINLNLYAGLAMAGMQGMLVLNAVVMATLLSFVVGFMMSLSTYCLNDMEILFLSLPIGPRALLGGKFVAVYLSEAVLSLFFMTATMVVFGIGEGPGPRFYLAGILAGLLLPLPALAASYLVQIPLVSAAGFLRNRKNIMLVGGVLGLILGLGFNIYFQRMMPPLADPSGRAALYAGPDSLVAAFGRAYPPALFAWRAMTGQTAGASALALLALAASCFAGPALLVTFLSGAYARSLPGFAEVPVKKLKSGEVDAFIARRFRSGPRFTALVGREFVLMNREPMYLLNGPFIIVLMPVIFGIMFLVQKDMLIQDGVLAGISAFLRGGFGAVPAGLIGAFLGSGTSIACTAVSRDAKLLPFMKSLPLATDEFMTAKLCHALAFGIFGSLVGVGMSTIVLNLPVRDALAGFAAALGLSSLVNLAGLWLDTANPRLAWDSPVAAMKQNPNAVVVILGAMGVLAGAGYLSFRLSLGAGGFAFWFGAVPGALFALLFRPCMRYARKRLAAMEV